MFEKNTMNNISDSSSRNLSVKKFLYIIFPFVIILVIVGVLLMYAKSSEKSGLPEQKDKILNRVELFEKGNNDLTEEEKKEMFENISGSRIQDYSFSREEKIRILKALNN